MGRKIIAATSPLMEIMLDGDAMSVKTSTLFWTLESSFKLDVEYEEQMPAKILKVCSECLFTKTVSNLVI